MCEYLLNFASNKFFLFQDYKIIVFFISFGKPFLFKKRFFIEFKDIVIFLFLSDC